MPARFFKVTHRWTTYELRGVMRVAVKHARDHYVRADVVSKRVEMLLTSNAQTTSVRIVPVSEADYVKGARL